ncbi:hypothetical protein E2C01_055059 [Portunus trituberculatus]|uniref:Uncharacterized protein n=1 Tax=Portunus trituberculatus TaxID=210409 RepID=A0A5B7GUX3_PORTR|nr:hypothetical protein [Portunus trituberculatus]
MGQWIDLECLVAQGTSTKSTKKGPILLRRTQPIRFFMEQADSASSKANEKKPTSVGYPSGRFAKIYSVAGQEIYGKSALVNPSLHATLNSSPREPRVQLEHPEVARMEGVVTKFRDALNYSFWCLGTMHLLVGRNLPVHLLDLEEQLFKAVRMVLNDACRDSTYVIANLRAWRREEALQFSKSNAEPRPALGTPLVECGPWPSTTITVRPSAAPAQRPPIAACARDSQGGFCGSRSAHPRGARRRTEGQALSEVTASLTRGQLLAG